MNKILCLLTKNDNKLATCFIFSCLLNLTSPALAQYKPPQDQRPPGGYTSTTGSRGGCEENVGNTLLTVLAPQAHIGQTASTHPTFAWFVPNFNSLPMEFSLYTYDSSNVPKVVEKIKMQTSPGIMKLALPEDKPGLTKGHKYLWQVAILCDVNYPSQDLVAQAEIEVVEMPSKLIEKSATVSDRLATIELLSQSGLWYDAFAAAIETGRKDFVYSLLEELANLEQPKIAASNSQQREKLKQILSNQQQLILP